MEIDSLIETKSRVGYRLRLGAEDVRLEWGTMPKKGNVTSREA